MNEYYSYYGWDLGIIEDGNNIILVDKTGNKIKTLQDIYIGSVEFGVAEINTKKDYYYGLLNSIGELVVPCKYDYLDIRSEYFSVVREGKKYGLVNNTNGKQVISCKYDSVRLESDDTVMVMINHKWGLIDLADNKFIVEPQYDKIYRYRDLWQIAKDDKMGYIDKTGKIVYMEL